MDKRKIIIITAPSGSGKTTLVKLLLKRLPELSFSVSACTRKPRAGEQDGKDYYFISAEEFQHKIEQKEFLEWEMVYPGKYYGTPKSELERIWDRHQYPLVDIDVQGALRVKKQFQGESLSVFIQAPSLEVLEQRLRSRGTETEESVRERIQKATIELSYVSEFDAVIINDRLEDAQELLYQTVSGFLKAGNQ